MAIIPCERYDELIVAARERELSEEEGLQCIFHEDECPTGVHTIAGIEKEWGLPAGAFEKGCPEKGILPAAESRALVMKRIRELGLIENELTQEQQAANETAKALADALVSEQPKFGRFLESFDDWVARRKFQLE